MSSHLLAHPNWKLIVDIFEPKGKSKGLYPVVRHEFYGVTKAEAISYCRAHMTTDVFMRDCVCDGHWKSLVCLTRTRWIEL